MSDKEKQYEGFENETSADVQKAMATMMKQLGEIYRNKSSDEYKMAGDITKSPVYDMIETSIANLRTLKGFPKTEISDYQNLFNSLHKPLYKKMVLEYMKEPNEKNTTFTTIFTVGYRTLVGDLARIYAATEATPEGIVYHAEESAKQRALTRVFIKSFNKNMEEEYNKAIRRANSKPKMHQEGAALGAIGSGTTAFAAFSKAHELGPIASMFRDVFNFIFGAKKELNATSFIGHQLTRSYDALVDKFDDTQKLYNATKEAYDEYKNSAGRHDPRIERNYEKNLKKYNIAMKTLQAKLAHFDSRAQAEAQEKAYREKMEAREQRRQERAAGQSQKETPKPTSKPFPKPTSKPTSAPTKPTSTSSDDEEKKPTAPPPKVDTGDLDF